MAASLQSLLPSSRGLLLCHCALSSLCKDTSHCIQDDLTSGSLVTSAKTPFSNKVTVTGTGG